MESIGRDQGLLVVVGIVAVIVEIVKIGSRLPESKRRADKAGYQQSLFHELERFLSCLFSGDKVNNIRYLALSQYVVFVFLDCEQQIDNEMENFAPAVLFLGAKVVIFLNVCGTQS